MLWLRLVFYIGTQAAYSKSLKSTVKEVHHTLKVLSQSKRNCQKVCHMHFTCNGLKICAILLILNWVNWSIEASKTTFFLVICCFIPLTYKLALTKVMITASRCCSWRSIPWKHLKIANWPASCQLGFEVYMFIKFHCLLLLPLKAALGEWSKEIFNIYIICHHTCWVSELVVSLVVKAVAIKDSPLWVIPLDVKSNIVRDGREGRAAARCWTPESPKGWHNV